MVVFPAPFGPRRPSRSPWCSAKLDPVHRSVAAEVLNQLMCVEQLCIRQLSQPRGVPLRCHRPMGARLGFLDVEGNSLAADATIRLLRHPLQTTGVLV